MGLRERNPLLEQTRTAREIVSSLLPEIGYLNEEAALIEAAARRQNLTEADGNDLLLRAVAAQAAVQRIEQRLNGALVGQPSEILGHGRIKDVRAAIEATRARLVRLGA
jgi:hypothetical protein